MVIRDAVVPDLNELTEIALRSKSFWPHSSDYIEKCRPYFTVRADELPSLIVRLVVLDSKILGWAGWIPEKSYLDHLWIEPAEIGKGLGKTLWDDGLVRMRERGVQFIELMADPYAVGFYEKLGCTKIGSMSSRILGGPDHVKMRLSF